MTFKRRIASTLTVLALAAGLSGCAGLNRSMLNTALSQNETLDQVERNTTLLNLLRAADQQQLTFTTFSSMGGNGGYGLSGSLSADSLRSLFNALPDARPSLGVNVPYDGFSFSLGSLDNEQFMRSFLADIPLDRLYVLSEGSLLDNEVLWTLVAESVSFDTAEGRLQKWVNAPEPKTWASFQTLMTRALRLGLTLEEVPEQVPLGPRFSRYEAMMQLSSVVMSWNNTSQSGSARPVLVETGDQDPAQAFQLAMLSNKVRLCFNPLDLDRWRYEEVELLCQKSGTRRAFMERLKRRDSREDAGVLESQGWREFRTRSPREVFYFLGRVLRGQFDTGKPWLVGDKSPEATHPPRPLINVVCDASPKTDPLAIAVYRGRTCHIPRDDGSHSAHVLQYLSLLVTLSKIPGALPTNPTVLIR